MTLTSINNQDVRVINAAIKRSAWSGGNPVLATTSDGDVIRIIHARNMKGQLQGMNLATGQWVNIVKAVPEEAQA